VGGSVWYRDTATHGLLEGLKTTTATGFPIFLRCESAGERLFTSSETSVSTVLTEVFRKRSRDIRCLRHYSPSLANFATTSSTMPSTTTSSYPQSAMKATESVHRIARVPTSRTTPNLYRYSTATRRAACSSPAINFAPKHYSATQSSQRSSTSRS